MADYASRTLDATGTNAGDIITLDPHNLQNGDQIIITATDATGISVGDEYFVISVTATTFQVASTFNGSAVALTGDGTAVTWMKRGGNEMIEGNWYELEVRWFGENAQGGPGTVQMLVDGLVVAETPCDIDDDETMELKIAHWQDSGAGATLELDIDYIEYALPRT